MTNNFVTTESQQELLKSVHCWKYIVSFLRTTYIINKNDTKAEQDKCEEKYETKLIDMKTTIQEFYIHVEYTFMAKVDKGDNIFLTCTPLGTTYLNKNKIYGINIKMV